MIKRIATVGGWTLISRISGFIRDVVMAAVLGAGPMADAFFVAFRLPNHFRAIFAEGAFAAAFVPAYARVLQQSGIDPAKLFADRIAAALIAINLVLLAFALMFTPWVVSILAPGFVNDPTRFDMAVALTRITFPYLALVSLEDSACRRAQRQSEVCRRRRRACAAQCFADRHPSLGPLFPERGLRRGLGRGYCRRGAGAAGRHRRRDARRRYQVPRCRSSIRTPAAS